MKKKVFSKYHETPESFEMAGKNFFQYIRKYNEDLSTLLTANLQFLDSYFATYTERSLNFP